MAVESVTLENIEFTADSDGNLVIKVETSQDPQEREKIRAKLAKIQAFLKGRLPIDCPPDHPVCTPIYEIMIAPCGNASA